MSKANQLIKALRACELVLDGLTPNSWDSGSPFDFKLKEAHRMAVMALNEGTDDGLPASYEDYVESLKQLAAQK